MSDKTRAKKPNPNELMNIKWVSEQTGLSVPTINRYIADADSDFPKGKKLHPGIRGPRRWRRCVIEQWIASDEAA